MKYDAMLKEKIYKKITAERPALSADYADKLLDRILACNDKLAANVTEWVEDKELSDILINEKYCINSVLKIRGDNDFLSALIVLDDYLNDQTKEFAIWQPRA